jgi:hypothetical protein
MIQVRFMLLALATFYLNGLVWSTLQHGQGWYALVTLPGTFLHEAVHYLFALALDGNPGTFSIIPTWDAAGNMQSMGHITFYPNWYNSAIVGLSPVLLAPMAALFIALAARTLNPLKVAGWCFLAVCAWQSCTPSSADLDVHGFYGSYLFALPLLAFSAWATYRVTRYILKI